MESEQVKLALIRQLWLERAKNGMTCAEIAAQTEAMGKAISERTVQRVFNRKCDVPPSCKVATLLIIAEAMGIELTGADEDTQNLIDQQMLHIRLEHAERQIAEKDARIAAMKEQIDRDDAHIAKQMIYMAKKDRQILLLTVSICVLLAIFACLLLFDFVQPNIGYITGH